MTRSLRWPSLSSLAPDVGIGAVRGVGRWAARTLLTCALALAFAYPTVMPSSAQAETRLTLTEAKKRLAEGRDAVTRKKPDVAIEKLTAAISSKRLRYKELAQALYLRGLAHRDAEKTALAIEDLTAALWIRNGLGAEDRKAALEARSSAYAQAGLTSQPGVATRAADVPSRSTPPARTSPPAAATNAATRPATTTTQSPARTTSRRVAARDVAPTEEWPPPSQFNSSGQTPQTTNGLANVGQNVTQFFSGLFGGASSSGAQTTASLPAASTPAPSAATSGWASQTAVKPSTSASRRSTAATSTRFKIQVAAVRAQSAAREIASRVNAKYGAGPGGQKADVRRVQLGNMGALYRVEFGPFASEQDSRPACAQLRRDGYDCLLLKQ